MVTTMPTLHIALLVCLVTMLGPGCHGHGRLIEPPARSSMWRYGYDTPKNYDDNQLFCGGFQVQYEQNGGKCGVCGDAWNGPRDHEPGGKYANGIIVRKYKVGDVIKVIVDLTASHKGYFEFHICPSDDPFNKVTHECLNRHPLRVAKTRKVRWPVPEEAAWGSELTIHLKLPKGMACRACMLQWKYNAGNSWGVSPDGKGCVGCGNQEQFYGCADVAVGHDDVTVGKRPDGSWALADSSARIEPAVSKTSGTRMKTGMMVIIVVTAVFIV